MKLFFIFVLCLFRLNGFAQDAINTSYSYIDDSEQNNPTSYSLEITEGVWNRSEGICDGTYRGYVTIINNQTNCRLWVNICNKIDTLVPYNELIVNYFDVEKGNCMEYLKNPMSQLFTLRYVPSEYPEGTILDAAHPLFTLKTMWGILKPAKSPANQNGIRFRQDK
jgi:hypothetical protein